MIHNHPTVLYTHLDFLKINVYLDMEKGLNMFVT